MIKLSFCVCILFLISAFGIESGRCGVLECPFECLNAGQCALHEISNQLYCKCATIEDRSGGFQGMQCEESYIQCNNGGQSSWHCLNGSTCNKPKLGCNCGSEFDGRFCENYVGPYDIGDGEVQMGTKTLMAGSTNLSSGTIIGITAGSLSGAIFFFLTGILIGRKTQLINKEIVDSSSSEAPRSMKPDDQIV